MKNPIKQWLQKRQQKKANKENLKWLKSVAQQHQWLDQLRTAGLLQWDVVQRRLFIEADLAVLFLQDAQRWTAFIHNTYQWLYYLESQTAVEDYFHQQELKAVREQLNQHPDLSRSDIDRIRRARRAEIMQSDVPTPKVEPFEFFIVRAEEPSTAAAQASGRLIAVGHYDPDTQHMEIAPWEDIQPLLQQNKE
jgi:hypothetical protein